ncbi:MAG: lasso peptide biosynthesis PqqD family chaperone [Mariprofundales bacterium]
MSINLNNTVRRHPEIVHNDMDGEIVMMSVKNGSYFGLNNVGSKIWEMLEQEMSGQQICEKLLEQFDVTEQQCHDEVILFLEKMSE